MNPNKYLYTEREQPKVANKQSWSGLSELIDDYFRFAWYDKELNRIVRRPPHTTKK